MPTAKLTISLRNSILHNSTTLMMTMNQVKSKASDCPKNVPNVIISNLPSIRQSRCGAYTGEGKWKFPKPDCSPTIKKPTISGINNTALPSSTTTIFTRSFFQSLIGNPFKMDGWRLSLATISIAKSSTQTINIMDSIPFNKRSSVCSAVRCSNISVDNS